MSTFAVFGMTAAQALADARKSTKNTRPSGKPGVPPVEITLEEWIEAVQRNADAIMAGVKVKQLSALFDTPQHARQFIELAKKAGACRDLKIRCKAALLDEKGKKILSPRPECQLSAGPTGHPKATRPPEAELPMPTENRSSNTEMVSVTRYLAEEINAALINHGHVALPRGLQEAMNAPCPPPHPEPIAWMVGTAFWWTKEEAERDAAETGLPIVGLGPMSGAAPAEQRQGEPVAAEGATFMGEPNFQHSIEWYREGISKHWKKICDLRAEVERLRAALKFYADREHYHFESGNWDTVSGDPLNILWCGEEPDFIEDGTVARAALERQS